MRICVLATAPPRPRRGNRVTALRWARVLRELGHRVAVRRELGADDGAIDLLVALHAGHSAPHVERFRAARPGVPVIVALTGTDLYDEIRRSPAAQRSLDLADRLVVLQERGIESLPERVRHKARAIVQSACAAAPAAPAAGAFRVCLMGHLREVKDPLRAAAAARLLPATSRVEIVHLGAALTEDMGRRARREAAENPRYRWLGELPRREALAILAGSQLLVVTSHLEGGANVVSEAIAAGVPVVSSRIDGSVGILGPDYPGTFPVGDTRALAALLDRVETDEAFREDLRRRCALLLPVVDPERERESWARLLADVGSGLGGDVRQGLSATPRRLSCRYFYDDAGSRLFEEICELPEYTLTRAEREILERRSDEIVRTLPAGTELWELGSGSAKKTRLLIDALLRRQPALRYHPVDLSASALADSARSLAGVRGLQVLPVAADYEEGLHRLGAGGRRPRLLLWLGSNIGNLDRPDAAAFLRRVGAILGPADRLLVGIDLRKDPRALVAAYDDPAGVTARFNLNILARVNRELGARFDLASFRHRATWDEPAGRIDMWLVSTRAQSVRIEALDLEVSFAEGEAIHSESSYKYSPAEIDALATAAGLRIEASYEDAHHRFRDVLLSR